MLLLPHALPPSPAVPDALQTFRKLAKTASAPHAVAAHAAATAVPALRSLLHSPMLSMTSNAEHPFHVRGEAAMYPCLQILLSFLSL